MEDILYIIHVYPPSMVSVSAPELKPRLDFGTTTKKTVSDQFYLKQMHTYIDLLNRVCTYQINDQLLWI